MKPQAKELTEYEQLVSEAFTAVKFFETEKQARGEIAKYKGEIDSLEKKRDKTISSIENEKPVIKISFEGKTINATNKNDIDTFIIYNGKKFGKPLSKSEPKNDSCFENPIEGKFWKINIISAIVGAVFLFGLFLTNEILALKGNAFIPSNKFHDIWLFDILGGAIGAAALSMFVCLIITFVAFIDYRTNNGKAKNCIHRYRDELRNRTKTLHTVYASELQELYKGFDNAKGGYVQKEINALTIRQECRMNSLDVYRSEVSKLDNDLNTCIQNHQNFEKNTVIPFYYISKEEVAKKMLFLLLNKRANNVTDLINLYETEEWRNKLLETISSEFKAVHQANVAMCSQLASLNTKTDFMIESINNVSVSIDKMNHSVTNRIQKLNSDLSERLRDVESSVDSVRTAVYAMDVTPVVHVNVDNH